MTISTVVLFDRFQHRPENVNEAFEGAVSPINKHEQTSLNYLIGMAFGGFDRFLKIVGEFRVDIDQFLKIEEYIRDLLGSKQRVRLHRAVEFLKRFTINEYRMRNAFLPK